MEHEVLAVCNQLLDFIHIPPRERWNCVVNIILNRTCCIETLHLFHRGDLSRAAIFRFVYFPLIFANESPFTKRPFCFTDTGSCLARPLAATKSCCRPWRLGPDIPRRDDERGCFRRLCKNLPLPSFRQGMSGPRCQGWQKLPVNFRDITIAKTLRPTTNIRALMSIVEEKLHIGSSRSFPGLFPEKGQSFPRGTHRASTYPLRCPCHVGKHCNPAGITCRNRQSNRTGDPEPRS